MLRLEGTEELIQGIAEEVVKRLKAERVTEQRAEKSPKRLMTIKEFTDRNPWPTEKGIRQYIFRAHENGMEVCLTRSGRRVLIDEEAFWRWIRMPNTKVPKRARDFAQQRDGARHRA